MRNMIKSSGNLIGTETIGRVKDLYERVPNNKLKILRMTSTSMQYPKTNLQILRANLT